MLEPTTRRVAAVLQQWDGTRGYAETAQGAGYHLHREHLERPQPVQAGMNVEIYLDENERGETERIVFRVVPLAGEDTAETRLPEHGRKLYADGKMFAWRAVKNTLMNALIFCFVTVFIGWVSGVGDMAAWVVAVMFSSNLWPFVLMFGAVLVSNLWPLLYRRSRPPVWVDNEQGIWLDGSMFGMSWAAQGRAYYFFDWRDIDAIRQRRSLFGREYWILTVRRSAVVLPLAGDAAAREARHTEMKLYPDILSRADRDTVRQVFTARAGFQAA